MIHALGESMVLWTCFWQTTFFLSVGFVATLIWRNSAARAHRLLLLSVIACFLTPALSILVYQMEWNFIPMPVISDKLAENEKIDAASSFSAFNMTPSSAETNPPASSNIQASSPISDENSAAAAIQPIPKRINDFTLTKLLLGIWIALSSIFIIRFILTIRREYLRFKFTESLANHPIQRQIDLLTVQLRLPKKPQLYASLKVSSPLIWCWGSPALILPKSAMRQEANEKLKSILCHELAHLKRRDHLAEMIGELLLCLYPWHPLAWWARKKLGKLSEYACDDWTLACGNTAHDYVDALMDLVTQKQSALVLSANRDRKILQDRIRYIFRDAGSRAALSRMWSVSSLFIMMLTITVIVFAQDASRQTSIQTTELTISAKNPASDINMRRLKVGKRSVIFFPADGARSFDGQYSCCKDERTGYLALLKLRTNEIQPIPHEIPWPEYYEFLPIISPDNQYIAYYKWMKYSEDPEQWAPIHVVAINGSEEKFLQVAENNSEECYFLELKWCLDSKHLCGLMANQESQSRLVLVSIDDGSFQAIKTFDEAEINVDISPDRRFLIYGLSKSKQALGEDLNIFLYDIAKKKETPLITWESRDDVVGWSPDGKWIVFTSNRLGSNDLWGLRFNQGKIQGFPQRLKSNVGRILPSKFGKDGSLYYYSWVESSQIYTFDIDENGVVAEDTFNPIGIRTDLERLLEPAWSSHGDQIAFVAITKTSDRYHGTRLPSQLFVQNLTTGEINAIPLNEYGMWSLLWSPDDRTIYACGASDGGWRFPGIYKFDIESLHYENVFRKDDNQLSTISEIHFAPKENSFIYKSIGYNEQTRLAKVTSIVRYDIDSNKKETIKTFPESAQVYLSVSPINNHIAIGISDSEKQTFSIVIVSEKGEVIRNLYETIDQNDSEIKLIKWTPDDEFIVCLRQEDSLSKFYRISSEGGQPEIMWETGMIISSFSLHPNGRQIAIAGANEERHFELWIMENFLPVE